MSFVDPGGEIGRVYWYRLMLLERSGRTLPSRSIRVAIPDVDPGRTELFAPRSAAAGRVLIRYRLGSTSPVNLALFDVAGRRVRTRAEGVRRPGEYVLEWDLQGEASARVRRGVYVIQLAAGDHKISRKLVLLRE